METVPLANATAFVRDIQTAKEAAWAGITQDAQHWRLCRNWSNFCPTLSVNPTLNIHPSLESKSFKYMDTGSDRLTNPSKVWTDLGKSQFLRQGGWWWEGGGCCRNPLLDGLPDPRNHPNSQAHTGLDQSLNNQPKTYRIEEPPLKREKASPFGIVQYIVATATTNSKLITRQVDNLVQLGLYF